MQLKKKSFLLNPDYFQTRNERSLERKIDKNKVLIFSLSQATTPMTRINPIQLKIRKKTMKMKNKLQTKSFVSTKRKVKRIDLTGKKLHMASFVSPRY